MLTNIKNFFPCNNSFNIGDSNYNDVKLKVLNLYSGIGGNSKLWKIVNVTAVEFNQEIANIYKDYFPDDDVIVTDAHDYLLKNFENYDFIWSSPPCPSHSRIQLNFADAKGPGKRITPRYPDMKLYQEIIFLNNFFKGKFCVENVFPYYEPLIKPSVELERHLFWSNFKINKYKFKGNNVDIINVTSNSEVFGFNLRDKKITHRKDQILINLVNPEIGLYIFEQAVGIIKQPSSSQLLIFDT